MKPILGVTFEVTKWPEMQSFKDVDEDFPGEVSQLCPSTLLVLVGSLGFHHHHASSLVFEYNEGQGSPFI